MNSLWRLSRYELAEILEYLDGAEINRLFFSGNSHLRYLLSTEGVVRHFRVTRFRTRVLSVPLSLLPHFGGLQTLKIIFPQIRSPVLSLHSQSLSTLPSTILSIEFHFLNAESCWLSQPGAHNMDSSSYFQKTSSFPFHTHFPQLHTLILAEHTSIPGVDTIFPSKSVVRLRDDDISLLPSSLTHLSLSSNQELSKHGLLNLPLHLQTLWLYGSHSSASEVAKSISRLPLRWLRLDEVAFSQNNISTLPHTLEYLHVYIDSPRNDTIKSSSNLSLNGPLRPSLEYNASDEVTPFPPQLHFLLISEVDSLGSSLLKPLPSTLRKLDLLACQRHELPDLSLLPRQLEVLRLPVGVDYKQSDVESLPRNLKELVLGRFNAASYALLPPFLERLDTMNEYAKYKDLNPPLAGCLWGLSFKWVGAFVRHPTSEPVRASDWKTTASLCKEEDIPMLDRILARTTFFDHFISHAVEYDSTKVLCLLIAQGKLLADLGGEETYDLVTKAVSKGSLKIIQFLLSERSISLDEVESHMDNEKLLHIAAFNGNVQMCECLMREGGRKPFVRDNTSLTAFHAAAAAHSTAPLIYFKSLWTLTPSWCESSLIGTWQEAIHLETLRQGYNTLHIAISHGRLENVQWLLNEGMSLHVPTGQGQKATELAKTARMIQWLQSQ